MAVLGLRFCARAFSSCGKRGPLFIAVRGPLTIAAFLVAEHRLQTCRLSNCGSQAQLLHGMWDLPRSGLKPVSPALAGRFLTTVPPGKPFIPFYCHIIFPVWIYTTFCLSIYQLMNFWIVSTFWLLWIMLLQTFIGKILCGHIFSFLLGRWEGVELLDHMVTFWGTARLLSRVVAPFYIFPQAVYEGSSTC